MLKRLARFESLPLGALFLTSSDTLPEDELWEKSAPQEAHQLGMPAFDRVGGTWRFQDHHVVTELISEYSRLSPTAKRN